jgi:hypothetical protein
LRNQELFDSFNREGKISAKSIGNQLMHDLDKWSNGRSIKLAVADTKASNRYMVIGTQQGAEAQPATVASQPEEQF